VCTALYSTAPVDLRFVGLGFRTSRYKEYRERLSLYGHRGNGLG
jgi:hypothetical protein